MKLSFQTIILSVFVFFIVIGVAVFAGYINIGSSSKQDSLPSGNVLVWGTVTKSVMEQFLSSSGVRTEKIIVTYVEKNPASYENELINAFASGKGPDIFMTTPEIYWKQRDKFFEIPYASYPLQTYTSTYMDLSKTYLTSTGIQAFPMFIDPMVGYWNKDIFASAGLATPPAEWRQMPELSKRISVIADDYTITRSAVALGEYANIRHAKDVMSLLFLQAGDPVLHVGTDNKLVIDLGLSRTAVSPAAIALDFYTQFSNPTKLNVYSWNKTARSDYDAFLAGDLAYYFGYSSEVTALRRGNPNLNFDMTFVPQPDVNGAKTTIGRLYGLAISKQSKNTSLAYYVTGSMLTPQANAALLTSLKNVGTVVAPVRRDMVPNDPTNVYAATLYQSALVAKNWIDPNVSFTNSVWQSMVTDVQSGKSNASNAVNAARTKMSAFLKTQ